VILVCFEHLLPQLRRVGFQVSQEAGDTAPTLCESGRWFLLGSALGMGLGIPVPTFQDTRSKQYRALLNCLDMRPGRLRAVHVGLG